MTDFTVYIDESGEAGVSRIRDGKSGGASPYFVLGAVLSNSASEIATKSAFSKFRATIRKDTWKHATDLGHSEKVLLARTLGAQPIRFFAVMSHKATLGNYKDKIDQDAQKFYNKCVKYLLENVCSYLISTGHSDADLRLVLERRNHDYDAMIRYIGRVKDNPIYEQSKSLRIFNPFAISTLPKGETVMLDVADFVSHAVYQCSNKVSSNYWIPETRYFSEMSSRFAGDKLGLILGVGIQCIKGLDEMKLDGDVARLLSSSKSRLPSHRG